MSTNHIAELLRKQSNISEISLKRALARKEATGKLRNNIGYFVSSTTHDARMLGIANTNGFPYWQVIDKGTKAPFKGIMPETADFRKWLQARGIPKTASFPIRRAISRRGLKPTYIFTNENDKTYQEVKAAIPAAWLATMRDKFSILKTL
jgi:hypothetical protein